MELETHIIKGPPVARITRTAAEAKLKEMPEVANATSYNLREIEGIWVAAVTVPKVAGDLTKESAPPPFAPPEADAPAEDGPAPDDGAGADNADGEPKPSDEGDGEGGEEKGGEKSLEHQVEALTHMLGTLMEALGLGDPGAEGPMGHEGEPGPPGPDMGGPDAGAGPPDKHHQIHERAMKPGEAPPGTTPIGSPAFASVQPDHPWAGVIGKKRTFTLEEPIGDRTMASVREELNQIAAGTGYSIKRAKEGVKDNIRVARVIVQADTPVA